MNEDPTSAPAPHQEPDLGQRLAACLSSSRLFSLDPEVVLSETAALMSEVLPGVEISVLAAELADAGMAAPLDEGRAALVDHALATGTTAQAQGGRRAAVPLCIRHPADEETLADAPAPRAIGAALLESPAPLSAASISVAELLADRAAVALEHAVMYQTQALIAQQLQRRLLPVDAPPVEGLRIGVLFKSRTEGALIGGDFVDFVSLSPRQVAVTVGDVSGKGVAAAAFTVITKYALRAIVATLSWPTWPGEALRDLHNALQGQLEPTGYVTVVLGLIDVQRRTLSVASAGHPGPFLIRDGVAEQPLLVTSAAIALSQHSELEAFPTERLELRSGDTLLFYTDGLSELRDTTGEFFEERALPRTLAGLGQLEPDRLVEALHAEALRFSARPPHDDVALVAVRLE